MIAYHRIFVFDQATKVTAAWVGSNLLLLFCFCSSGWGLAKK